MQHISQLCHHENGIPTDSKRRIDASGAYSYDIPKYSPIQTGWAWVLLPPDQILSNFEIVYHLAKGDHPQNFAKNHEMFEYGFFFFKSNVLVSFYK